MRSLSVPSLALAILGLPAISWAQPDLSCAPRPVAVKNLAERYSETQVAYGITQGGGLLEIFARADGKTWTVLVTGPDAVSCVFSAGEGWRRIEPLVPKGTRS